MEKIKLDIDFESLFPGKSYKILTQEIQINPLNVKQIAYLIKKFQDLIPIINENDISFANIEQPSTVIKLVSILMEQAPEVISEITGIDINSIQKLPLDKVIELTSIAIEVNVKSKKSLEKNFQKLKTNLMDLLPTEMKQAMN